MRRLGTLLGFLAMVSLLASALALLAPVRALDRFLAETRMTLIPRDFSGDVIYVAIDTQSLNEFGVWPWPRSKHAQMLTVLSEAGVRDVFFDVDFAFPGSPDGDAALIAALRAAGGATYLPLFAQFDSVDGQSVAINRPLPAFAAESWPALINLFPDSDGILRRYPYGAQVDGESLASVASLLAGVFGADGDSFLIDQGFDPQDLPTYSYSQVLSGAVPPETFAGRTVIVGAFALELRDTVAVPVHGVLPGPLIHAMATETLASGRVPTWLRTGTLLPFVALLSLALWKGGRRRPVFASARLIVGGLLALEGAAFLLQQQTGYILPTAPAYPTLLLVSLWLVANAYGVKNWRIERTQAQLEKTVDLLAQVFSDSSDAILVMDQHGDTLHYSRMARRLFGLDGAGRPIVPDALEWAAARALDAYEAGKWQPDRTREFPLGKGAAMRIIEYTVTPSEVTSRLDDAPRLIVTLAARDVTENRRQAAKLDYLSSHDERTGALRRGAFFRNLGRAARPGTPVAIFALNLHRFKTINATLGRDIGDQVLRQTVERLKDHPEKFGQVTRLNGDSFAVYMAGVDTPEEARRIASEIVRSVTRPFELAEARAQVGVRVGFALDTLSREVTGPVLLDRAEEALDMARSKVGNRIAAHDAETSQVRIRARAIEQAMSGAIGRGEFHLLYQPQVDLDTGRLCGVEALVRWTHPDLGRIQPDEFIPIAESNGFIQDLGAWVLQQAMKEGLLLPPGVSLAVNVSAIQMMSNRIVTDVRAALDATGFPADRLWLELTESSLLTPTTTMLQSMDDIERLGAAWALDDFGTGFSSLSYMATLPIRKLKVDRAFVTMLEVDRSALAIIRSVQVMCEGLGIKMLCEGIETRAQADILRRERCAEAQGYLYGRPEAMAKVVARHTRTRQIA